MDRHARDEKSRTDPVEAAPCDSTLRRSFGATYSAVMAESTAAGESEALVRALCALGPIACRPGPVAGQAQDAPARDPLGDWAWRVVSADAYAHQLGASSPWESVRLEGAAGSLALMLLPDTNFLAWDQLLELFARRLPRRAGRVQADRGTWRVCRFERIEVMHARLVAVPRISLSPCGRCVLNLQGEAPLD